MPDISFAKCYSILNIENTQDLELIRKAYKSQIQRWHPDRFPENSSDKIIAEEKIKSLNAAYKILSDFYKKNGALPTNTESNVIEKHPRRKSWKTNSNINSQNEKKRRKYNPQSNQNQSISITKTFFKGIILTILISGTSYIIFSSTELDMFFDVDKDIKEKQNSDLLFNPQLSKKHYSIPALTLEKNNNIKPIESKDNDDYFTIGSSIGKVIMVQGKPSRIDRNTWYYGKSIVYFDKGNVVEWVRHSDNPLKVKLMKPERSYP